MKVMFPRWANLPTDKSLLLLGPRRAGKSTLLKARFPQHTYVTLDDLDALEWARNDAKDFIASLGTRFIIDEAQRAPNIAVACKYAIDQQGAHAILTGSTGLELFQSTTETMAGRIEIRELPPSCFGEAEGPALGWRKLQAPAARPQRLQAQRELAAYLRAGGFPEVVTQPTPEARDHLLQNYKNTYFTRDLADLSQLENLEGLRALYSALIRGLCSRYEVSSLARESGLSVPTTKKYLNSLLQSGLAFKLYGFHLGPSKRYLSKAKTYFCDNGVITSLSNEISQAQLVENFVVSEIEKRRKLGLIRAEALYYYESTGGREIDLIVEEPRQLVAIEIKSSRTVTGREIRNLRDFRPPTKKPVKRILYYAGNDFQIENDIEIRPLWTLWR